MEETERDLLVKLDTQMHSLCKKMEKFHDENRLDHQRIMDIFNNEKKITDEKNDKKIDKKIFTWVSGIIITIIIILFTYVGSTDISTQKHFNNIESCIQIYHPEYKTPVLYKIPKK